jgi:DNA-binding MarR family transcriptional regulator
LPSQQRQTTWEDLEQAQRIIDLKPIQRRILSLLGTGHSQSDTAKLIKKSAGYVCQETKRLETLGLIKKQQPKLQSERIGKRQRTYFYELSEEGQALAQGEVPQLTSCRVHHIGVKYRITRQSDKPSEDKRTGFSKDWKLKGWTKRAYWYPGRAGLPSVTLYLNVKQIEIWVDKGQHITAASIQDAERLGDEAIAKAREQFIQSQQSFGVYFTTDSGKMIGDRHYGFSHLDGTKAAQQGVTLDHWWEDKSVKEVEPHLIELETKKREYATPLDRTIQLSKDLEGLPDLIKQTINPLSQDIAQVQAMIQGGTTLQSQYNQMLHLLTATLAEMAEMRNEMRGLKGVRE